MSEKKETEFIGGFYPKNKHEKAPDFVKGAGSFKVDQALDYFTKLKNEDVEWINYQVLASKKDNTKLYAQRDFWEPTGKEKAQQVVDNIKNNPEGLENEFNYPKEDINPEDIPF